MTTRLPDAEIDDVIASDPSGLTPTSVAQDLALEVRERRAAEKAPIGSDLERQIRRAAEPLAASIADSGVPWATADELQACPAEKLRYTRESADFVAACSPANVLALLSELAQLRARVAELEGERSKREDAEASRWQERIAETIERAGLDPWDASGNDSGDPLDWTDDQVGHAIRDARLAALRECHAALMSSDAPLKAIGSLIEESE